MEGQTQDDTKWGSTPRQVTESRHAIDFYWHWVRVLDQRLGLRFGVRTGSQCI